MAESFKKCTGDCLKCSFQQQMYCTSQRAYQMMKNQEALFNKLEELSKSFAKESIIPFGALNGQSAENKLPEEKEQTN